MCAGFDDLKLIAWNFLRFQPARELKRQQFAKQRTYADAGKKITTFADLFISVGVITIYGIVESAPHKRSKWHGSVVLDVFTKPLDEGAHEKRSALGVKFLFHRAAVSSRMAKIDAFFNLMFEQKASDVHLSSGNPPILRINGELQRVEFPPLESDQLKAMLYEITPEYKIKQFEETGDVDFGYEIPGVSRFRANFFNQKNGVAAVFRQIPSKVLSFEDFEKIEAPLPPVLKKFCMLHKGLVLVTGPTGSGKSTTLAAMVDYANKNRRDHILTVEDPIEFVHESKNCLVNHREVGIHTRSFASALKGALREDPDVILVGEMRDLETIELAITAASTGHLVFGTLHTSSAAKTVDRIIDVFPADQQNKIRATLSEALKGVVAQNLFKRVDKKGRVAALEILVFTTAIANLVREGKTHQLPGMIQVGKKIGNVPLDDAIMDHLRMKRISPEEAYDKCLDKKKFRPFLSTPPLDDEVAPV
jgi:twitching motility protein PilT